MADTARWLLETHHSGPMTTQSLPLLRRIQVLLNTLIGEHHVRRSLLHEVCDLMGREAVGLEDAHRAASDLLHTLDEGGRVDDFDGSIERIAMFVERSPLASRPSAMPAPAKGVGG